LDTGLAPATCNRAIQLLRHSLNLAVDWEFLERNPAARIKMFREDNEIERYLSDAQLQSLVSVLKMDHNRPVSNILMWLLSTGSRLNETLQAKWENIDRDNRTWKIPVADAKSRKSRTVVLNDAAVFVLAECAEITKWLFPNPQTEKPYTTVSRVWYRMRKKAGIPEFRIHDLRHSYASYLAQAGESTITIAESLGHSDYRVSQRYVHLNQDTLRKAANHASDKIMAALDKVSGQN
jgi:integrase